MVAGTATAASASAAALQQLSSLTARLGSQFSLRGYAQAGGQGILQVWMPLLSILLILLLGTAVALYFGGLYHHLPGWGPLVRRDNSGGNGLRIRQHMIKEHVSGSGEGGLGGATANDDEKTLKKLGLGGLGGGGVSIWDRDPGNLQFHPQYGSVVVREDFKSLQETRKSDPMAPRDEPHFMAAAGTSLQAGIDSSLGIEHKMA